MAHDLPIVPSFIREDTRGRFVEVVNTGPWETVISAMMHSGAVLGNHYHKKTRLYLYVVQGKAEVHRVHVHTHCRRILQVAGGQGLYLEPNDAHAIRFPEETQVLLLKSRRYAEGDPDTFPFRVLDPAATM